MTKRRRIKKKKSVPVRSRASRPARSDFGFASFSSLGGSPEIRSLLEPILRARSCQWCGQRHGRDEPPARRIDFDPGPYLRLLANPIESEPASKILIKTDELRPASPNLLRISSQQEALPKRTAKKPLFKPAELAELSSLAPRTGAEKALPALERQLAENLALPWGLTGIGREAALELLAAADNFCSPLLAAGESLRRVFPGGEASSEVLPAAAGKIPDNLSFASGVPKNLPVATDSKPPIANPQPPNANCQMPIANPDSFLDRLERLPDLLLDSLRRPHSARRSSLAFTLLALIMVMPVGAISFAAKSEGIKSAVIARGQRGVNSLLLASEALRDHDPAQAAISFGQAAATLSQADSLVKTGAPALRRIAAALSGSLEELRAAEDLLTAANDLARAGQQLSQAASEAKGNLLFSLAAFSEGVKKSLPDLQAAATALDSIKIEALPAEYRSLVEAAGESLRSARLALTGFPEQAEVIADILGGSSPRRYLLIFQNANELRATGGFIGSLAEVTVKKGEISELRLPPGGAYDLQGDLRAHLLPPPPLRLVSGEWQFHDANWFPDFPESAGVLSWFYQKAGGPTVDGVISVNSEILPKLLTLVGPIAMPEYRRTITSDNVIAETQEIVESDAARESGAPKKFVADLLGEVLRRLRVLGAEKMLAAGELLGQAFREKTIQAAFFEERAKNLAAENGWAGELYRGGGDSLMVADTNIGGGKTDAVVEKSARLRAEISSDGAVTNTLTLEYRHRGRPTDRWGGQTYRDFLRLYLPEGSEFLDAVGRFGPPAPGELEAVDPALGSWPLLESTIGRAVTGPAGTLIWSESGRKVFGNWLTLKPGESAKLVFVYRSGAALTRGRTLSGALTGADLASYRLRWEKQSGSALQASLEIVPPEYWATEWRSPDLEQESGQPTALTTDRFYGLLLSSNH